MVACVGQVIFGSGVLRQSTDNCDCQLAFFLLKTESGRKFEVLMHLLHTEKGYHCVGQEVRSRPKVAIETERQHCSIQATT